jgi:peptidoglycan/xylan/chitin deacetylase (PgdA/CDA1 family)
MFGIVTAMIILACALSIPAESKPHSSSSSTHQHKSSQSTASTNINNDKVVMINFDDGYKSQFLYAKPILDQYGYKASFFIPCAKMETEPKWLTWQQITGSQE